MLKVSRSFAAACSKRELHCLLHGLFNKLAEDTLKADDRKCCLVSIQTCRTELAHPSR